jgi:hypothetical protein
MTTTNQYWSHRVAEFEAHAESSAEPPPMLNVPGNIQ